MCKSTPLSRKYVKTNLINFAIIKCAKSLGIGTGLGSSSFKTTDFFPVNPFMGMFIICELRTGNLRITKLRTKMRTRSLIVD